MALSSWVYGLGLLSLLVLTGSSRLVVTFHNASDNFEAGLNDLKPKLKVVKQYGRRLVLELEGPVDLEVERDNFKKMFKSVQSVEIDHLVGLTDVLTISDALAVTEMNASDPNVDGAYISPATQTPLWNLMDSEPYSIHVEGVWQVTNSTPSVVVAVVDTGMAEPARYLFLNLLDGYDFISDEGISIDGDGRDPDSTDPGDWGDTCPTPSWHGTKVASILAARHDNEFGMKGIAQNCSILPLRVLGLCRMGYATDVADAIVWAAGGLINSVPTNPKPANIISLSLTGRGSCPDYLQSAIHQAVSLGSVVIAAAGNSNQNVSGYFPANCEGVIAVAASTREGTLAGYSNWGELMSAPGGDSSNAIMSLGVNALETGMETAYGMGTSFAAPHAAGTGALYLGKKMCAECLLGFLKGMYRSNLNAMPINQITVRSSRNSTVRGAWCDTIGQCCLCNDDTYSVDCCESCSCANEGTYMVYGYQSIQGFNCIAQKCYGCTRCPIGQYNPACSDSVGYCAPCVACSPGQYLSVPCSEFASGQWGDDGICSSCAACGANQYRSGCVGISAGTCTQCACSAGTYTVGCSGVSPGSCPACNQGNYCPGGSSGQAGCTSGNYCPAGSISQTVCALGSYCPNTFTQTACASQNYCAAGSIAQAICPAGSYCPNPSTKTTCAPGNYCPSGSVAQTLCAVGYFCITPSTQGICSSPNYCAAGVTAQTSCPAGFYCPNPSTKTPCTSGYYCPAGSVSQALCALGSYCSTTSTQQACVSPNYCAAGSVAQAVCPAGSYCPNPSTKTTCSVCGAGFSMSSSCTATVDTVCASCIAGSTYTTIAAQTACSTCSVCSPGYYATSACTTTVNRVCGSCAVGTYTATSGQSTCSTCSVCSAGYYLSVACKSFANAVCIQCPQGGYCPSGQTTPTLCAAGSYGVAAGASTIANCAACPAGSYTSAPGASACVVCAANSFVATTGATACLSCAVITVCAQGQYANACTASTDSLCTQCIDANKPAYSYWLDNQVTCTWACNRAPLYFKSGSVCQACSAPSTCAIGQYITTCATTANGVCTACNNKPLLNSVYTSNSPNYDQSACAWGCNDGYTKGASSCDPCPAGMYSANSPTCQSCPAGTYSGSGSSACTVCSIGTFSTAVGQPAASVPVALTWLHRNLEVGDYYLNMSGVPNYAPSLVALGAVVDSTYYQAYPIYSTLDASLPLPATITLATRSRTTCDTSANTGMDAFMQVCATTESGNDLGSSRECHNVGVYGYMNMSTTPFGVQSSSFLSCAGNSNGISVSCPTTTFCSFRGISRSCCPWADCAAIGFTGSLNILNGSWFRSDIAQACAMYKGSSGLTCVGDERITYTTASPCLSCPTGSYPPSASSACVLCGTGKYLPSGTTSCLTCPTGSTTLATGTGDAIGAVMSLPVAQYSASSSSISTAYTLNGAGVWVGATTEYPFQRSWLQMDLLSVLPVKAVVTQGGSASSYVTAIRVDASVDGVSYITIAKSLSANVDGVNIVSNAVQAASGGTLYARYIRIYVLAFYKQPGLRAGLKLGLSGCLCMPGYYASVQYPSECAACPAGTYSSGFGQSACTPCAFCSVNGSYRVGCGGSSPGTCDKCTNIT